MNSNATVADYIVIVFEATSIPVNIVVNVIVLCATVFINELHRQNNFIVATVALADLFVGVFTNPIGLIHHFPEAYDWFYVDEHACRFSLFVRGLPQLTSLSTLLFMCIERFLCINFPFCHEEYINKKNTIIILIFIWIYNIITSVIGLSTGVDFDSSIRECETSRLFGLYLVSFVVLAVIISFCLCVHLARQVFKKIAEMRKQEQAVGLNARDATCSIRSNDTKITLWLTFAFIVLWIPTPIYFSIKMGKVAISPQADNNFKNCLRLLRVANSVLNPILYALTKKSYKIAYKYMLTHPPWMWAEVENAVRMTRAYSITDSRQKSSLNKKENGDLMEISRDQEIEAKNEPVCGEMIERQNEENRKSKKSISGVSKGTESIVSKSDTASNKSNL